MPLRRRDGSYFGTLCTLDPAPITPDNGVDDDAFAIFTLLADLIARELAADEQQLQRAAQLHALEEVIAIAGHDLRQPLTVLLVRLQLLARTARRATSTPEELATRVEALIAQANRAVNLSETLVDLVHLEAGGLTLRRAPLDLVALARRAIAEAQLGGPHQHIRLDAPPTLPYRGDERRLGQALRNLLAHAVGYAPAAGGPIVVALAASERPDGTREIALAVTDGGPGLPPAVLAQLFDRDHHDAAGGTRDVRGSGLGLYIAGRIVAAHGGRIWAEAVPEGGLAVRLVLPADATPSPTA